ncbi:MAG: RsmF rRNA methyltransferase first C-terminal domain-containing protein [Clostridia bacterium]|nr:RsmF rRNA methyltransferase first C-terminal domain-containing protein [Clostridia bacterium]
MNVPQDFLNRIKARMPAEYSDFAAVYGKQAVRGIRVNTLKIPAEEFAKISPFAVAPVPWEKDGFYITEEKPGKFAEHFAGLYYVQEPSAMCAAPLLNVKGGEAVLDLCSAPGGKGTQLAQSMGGNGIIFLNEINFTRAKILSQNAERMGIRNAVVTVASPEALTKEYAGCFDKILVDAPCSGEGMFRKEEAAVSEWSLKNVEMCSARQREILNCAHKLLKDGGSIVYSTCTFAEEEDEWQVNSFLAEHTEYKLERQEKLYPHKVLGEGHFAALMRKCGGETNSFTAAPVFKDKQKEKLYRTFESDFLTERFDNLYLAGDVLYSLPYGCPVPQVQTLRAGVRLGEFVNGRFTPSHSLAMCLGRNVSGIELSEGQAYDYLKGLTVACSPSASGWQAVTYKGFPLGWSKCSGGVAKNHYPKGLRILSK